MCGAFLRFYRIFLTYKKKIKIFVNLNLKKKIKFFIYLLTEKNDLPHIKTHIKGYMVNILLCGGFQ